MSEHDADRSAERVKYLIAEQAAEWLLRLSDGEAAPADRMEFSDWLRASPVHMTEFLNAKATWEALSGRVMESFPDGPELLRAALDSKDSVVTFAASAAPARSMEQDLTAARHAISVTSTSPPRRLRNFAIAATVALALAAGMTLWFAAALNPNTASYSTATGEQSTRRLPDGSVAVLNTRSKVRLQWSPKFRDVYLEAGEALFEVSSDASRPFRVWSGDSMIRALGTKFNVYRTPAAVRVTVLDGRVVVTNAPTGARRNDHPNGAAAESSNAAVRGVELAAGEEARVEQATIHTQRLVQPERAVSWQTRRLVFEQTPLAEVIAEFNRYDDTPLRLEDETLGRKRINGIFDAADRGSLLEFLREFENIDVVRGKDEVVVRSREHQPS